MVHSEFPLTTYHVIAYCLARVLFEDQCSFLPVRSGLEADVKRLWRKRGVWRVATSTAQY